MQGILERIADQLIRREEERRRFGETLRQEISDFIMEVEPQPVNERVGAVDGGMLHEEYGSTILLILRSVGAVFSYQDSSLDGVIYIPSPLPDPDIVVNDLPLEPEDFHPFISLNRLRTELQRAIQVAETDPDFLFLDGSIVPQIVDKPRSTHLYSLYKSTISLFTSLYSYYPSTMLSGIVKDSRGNRFGLYLRDEGIDVPNWQDVAWLSYVLKPGEYTRPVPYSEDPRSHATLRDLKDHADNIYISYIKVSPYDRPFRIEFYSTRPEEDLKRISNLIFPLSSTNPHYSIPPFMVEVDLRARLSKESLSYVKSYLERVIMARFPSVKLFERRPM